MVLHMPLLLQKLSENRPVFVSEADFQFELGWMIKSLYPNAMVRCEYTPEFDTNMHIDILVILDGKWIPIELKYKTKGSEKVHNEIKYVLKNHSAKDVNCYLYLKDIQRIEKIKNQIGDMFAEGYTVFITNDISYTKKPGKQGCIYEDFALANGTVKNGTLVWAETAGAGTTRGNELPIELQGSYPCEWAEYSLIDNSISGKFVYLCNTII